MPAAATTHRHVASHMSLWQYVRRAATRTPLCPW